MNVKQTSQDFTMEVFGEASVKVQPNQAIISLGVVNEGSNLQAVQAENAKTINQIIQALLSLHVPKDQIQTEDYRIEAQYDYKDGEQIFRGYKVTHMLSVITNHVGMTGLLVDTAVAYGANSINQIKFTISQPEFAYNQALSLAVRNAQTKAKTIADTLDVRLAAVPYRIVEASPAPPVMPFEAKVMMAGVSTPIQPGQLTISASVKLSYSYLPAFAHTQS